MKRTTEFKLSVVNNYSVVRFTDSLSTLGTFPSDESLGYSQSSAYADSEVTFWAKPQRSGYGIV